MATRYIGRAVVRIKYVGSYMSSGSDRTQYAGSVSDGARARWHFDNISASGAEQARLGLAADGAEAYDEMAASAVNFASNSDSGDPSEDVAEAISEAASEAQHSDGSYLVRRKR